MRIYASSIKKHYGHFILVNVQVLKASGQFCIKLLFDGFMRLLYFLFLLLIAFSTNGSTQTPTAHPTPGSSHTPTMHPTPGPAGAFSEVTVVPSTSPSPVPTPESTAKGTIVRQKI